MDYDREVARDFISAIIYRALFDWKFESRRKEIAQFFNSKWGKYLCSCIELDAKTILRRLEEGKVRINGEDLI